MRDVLTKEELIKLDKYFNACNYLSVGQLYLVDNPLLKRPLLKSDLKKRIVGHWGTAPGQNFIYTHLNRIIKKYDLDMIYISGPGHGGEAIVSNVYLEGSYTDIYKDITMDENGMKKLFKQFSFPKGISSHVAPETPGSINEGGELGYSLSHAFGAALDNKNLIVSCVIGDGEAETGPLATSWNINKFLNKKNDGVVLPILHLNGYKIANPTVLGRMENDELLSLFRGYGWDPYIVEGNSRDEMHQSMAYTLDIIVNRIREIKENPKLDLKYPMIIFRSLKGWTGPREVEGSFKAHQVPIELTDESKIIDVENWMRSYHPEELFDENGTLIKELQELLPPKEKRMGLNKHANGGLLLKELKTPNIDDYKVDVKVPGSLKCQDMMELGKYIRDLLFLNRENRNFRIFGPDEALSNRLNYVFEETRRQWESEITDKDEFLDKDGRVIDSYLSEHFCEGALEGYILTGRHGFFHTYEAFVRIIDSMASQHAKWLKVCRELPWRKSISSLNYILTSHIWQQDHNGFTHQDPGFLNHLATKKADIVRMYLPPDTNCLLSCFDHVIKTKDYINVIVASKHPSMQWLDMESAKEHCEKGIGIWKFASDDDPDIVLACAGDTPTVEVLAATTILRKYVPQIKIRVVNVVDLMKLESNKKHPHGLTDEEYNNLFTVDKPIIFNFHGYPSLIHQLVYNRENKNIHVHGYNEEGTITTPFDMRVQNKIDRFNLVIDALKYLDNIPNKDEIIFMCNSMLEKHNKYIAENGVDMDEVNDWKWDYLK
mgnify:FL=1